MRLYCRRYFIASRKEKNTLNATVAILHYILQIWLFKHLEW